MEYILKCDTIHVLSDKMQSAGLVGTEPRLLVKVWKVPSGTFEEGKQYKINIEEVKDNGVNMQ